MVRSVAQRRVLNHAAMVPVAHPSRRRFAPPPDEVRVLAKKTPKPLETFYVSRWGNIMGSMQLAITGAIVDVYLVPYVCAGSGPDRTRL
jgi:hypothetical protein